MALLDFTDDAQHECYETLRTCRLGDIKTLDWLVLGRISLADQILPLMSVGSWERFFVIQVTVFREI